MLTNNEYLIVWGAYGVAGLGLLAVLFRFSRFFPRQIRGLFRALSVVVIYTPWFVDAGQQKLAPAIIVLAFDYLIKEQADPLRALMPIVVAAFGACIFLLIESLISRTARKKAKPAD